MLLETPILYGFDVKARGFDTCFVLCVMVRVGSAIFGILIRFGTEKDGLRCEDRFLGLRLLLANILCFFATDPLLWILLQRKQ